MARGLELTAQPRAPEVPAGLPSSLLERRPDVREVEAQLMAANAQIGVAKAAYYPEVTLTGEGGFQSVALSNLFTGPAGLWSFAGQLAQPLYAGGQLRGAVRLSEAQKEQLALTYQQTIQERVPASFRRAHRLQKKIRTSASNRNCSPTPRRTQTASPICATKAAPQVIWKSSTQKPASTPPNSISPKRN